jgi:hypothetical protein
MTSTTKANASRKEVRDSIKSFALLMSEAPAPRKPEPVFALDAETARRWAMVQAAR